MHWEDEVIQSNPQGVMQLMGQYNCPPPQSQEEMYARVAELTNQHGQKFLEQLSMLHPDPEAIYEDKERGSTMGMDLENILGKINNEFSKLPAWARVASLGFMTYATFQFLFNRK